MNEDHLYAISTVALSVYNLLASTGRDMRSAELRANLSAVQLPGITKNAMKRAIAGLKRRGLVTKIGKKYRSIDPKRRVVSFRDRSDVSQNKKTGECLGGWNRWMARDQQRGLIPVEEIARAARLAQGDKP